MSFYFCIADTMNKSWSFDEWYQLFVGVVSVYFLSSEPGILLILETDCRYNE